MFEQKYKTLFNKINGNEDHKEKIREKMKEELILMNKQDKFTNKNKPNQPFYKYAAIAAAVLLVSVVGYKSLGLNSTKIPVADQPNTTQATDTIATAQSPVLYSSLNFPDSVTLEAPNSVFEMNGKIAPFTEKLLAESKAIIKGTVTKVWFKDYQNPDVSGELSRQTVVYEIKVDKVFFSNGAVKVGDEVVIENDLYTYTSLANSVDRLKANHQYIVALIENGETLDSMGKPISAESNLSILYPFAPQIEITQDGQYLFPDHWSSLINSATQTVTMDGENSSNYYGEMKLRQDSEFETDFQTIVDSKVK